MFLEEGIHGRAINSTVHSDSPQKIDAGTQKFENKIAVTVDKIDCERLTMMELRNMTRWC